VLFWAVRQFLHSRPFPVKSEFGSLPVVFFFFFGHLPTLFFPVLGTGD
jgi:hypothetical protein